MGVDMLKLVEVMKHTELAFEVLARGGSKDMVARI